MIGDTEKIESLLDSVARQVSIIQNDFYVNGQVHYNYMLEKLNKAKICLDDLIYMVEGFKEKAENGGLR